MDNRFILRDLLSKNLPTEKLYQALRKFGNRFDLNHFVGGRKTLFSLLRQYQSQWNYLNKTKANKYEINELLEDMSGVLK